jgi:hypothetical protein
MKWTSYDQTNIPEVYDQGRDHGPAVLDQWMRVIVGNVGRAGIYDILDLAAAPVASPMPWRLTLKQTSSALILR